MIYRSGSTVGSTYREGLQLEMDRQLAEWVSDLGPKPSWWRLWMRKLYVQKMQILRDAQLSNLRWMLNEQDQRRRAVMANLIGWKLPGEYADDLDMVADSPDPAIREMLKRYLRLKMGSAALGLPSMQSWIRQNRLSARH